MMCIATNWVIVGNCFVVACRRWAFLRTGTLSTIGGLQRWRCILLPSQQLLHGELQRWGCALLWTVFSDQNAEFPHHSSGKLCIVAQVGKVQFLCVYIYIWMRTYHSSRERSLNGHSTEFKRTVWDGKCVPASWRMCNMSGCIFILYNKIGTF